MWGTPWLTPWTRAKQKDELKIKKNSPCFKSRWANNFRKITSSTMGLMIKSKKSMKGDKNTVVGSAMPLPKESTRVVTAITKVAVNCSKTHCKIVLFPTCPLLTFTLGMFFCNLQKNPGTRTI